MMSQMEGTDTSKKSLPVWWHHLQPGGFFFFFYIVNADANIDVAGKDKNKTDNHCHSLSNLPLIENMQTHSEETVLPTAMWVNRVYTHSLFRVVAPEPRCLFARQTSG